MNAIAKSTRVLGADRVKAQREIVASYAKGQSIRDIAASCGRSYGWVHRIIAESDTPLRGRGGNHRKASTK